MKKSKKFVTILVAVAAVTALAVPAFAVGTAPTGMDTALTTVKDDALAALAVVAPVGIAILGAFLVWKYGIKFFKGLAK